MPEISVIVPVYKVETYLQRCIESILAQTFTNFELILIDDGSPDRCPVICDEYAKKDSRIHVIHQLNGGISAARNKGVEWAKSNSDSRWISFVDSDDWVHPLFLERLLYAAQEYKVSVSCCKYQRIREEDLPAEICDFKITMRQTVDVYCSDFGTGIEAYPWRFLYDKRLFDNVCFPIGKIYEDIFTTYKLIFQTQNIAEVSQGLYYYFYRGNSLTHSVWTPHQLDFIEAYEENLRYFKGYPSQKLINCLAHGYLVALHSQYMQLQNSDMSKSEKNRYKKLLKSKIRIALVHYAKFTEFKIENSGYLYAIAYPHIMDLYWLLNGQLRKLKK